MGETSQGIDKKNENKTPANNRFRGYGKSAIGSLAIAVAGVVLWFLYFKCVFTHPAVYIVSFSMLVLIWLASSYPRGTHDKPSWPIRLLGHFRRHVFRACLGVFSLGVVVLLLLWEFMFSGGSESDPRDYMFFSITAVVAAVAATGSVLSSMSAHESTSVANESLQLTRASQRPFMDISSVRMSSRNGQHLVSADIANKGPFPADGVTLSATLRANNDIDGSEEYSLTAERAVPQTWFPNMESGFTLNDVYAGGILTSAPIGTAFTLRLDICYRDKLANQPHWTSRSYAVEKLGNGNWTARLLQDCDRWN